MMPKVLLGMTSEPTRRRQVIEKSHDGPSLPHEVSWYLLSGCYPSSVHTHPQSFVSQNLSFQGVDKLLKTVRHMLEIYFQVLQNIPDEFLVILIMIANQSTNHNYYSFPFANEDSSGPGLDQSPQPIFIKKESRDC